MKYFTWDKIRPITDTASLNNWENWIYCHLSGGCNHSLRLTDRKPLSFSPLLFSFLSLSFSFSHSPHPCLFPFLSLWRVACQSYSTNITFSFPCIQPSSNLTALLSVRQMFFYISLFLLLFSAGLSFGINNCCQ